MDKLKYMDLTNSSKLIRAPDFTETPNLENLVLDGCTSLVEVHPSIGALKKLVLLDLSGCENLRSLPKSIHLVSLKVFRGATNSKTSHRSPKIWNIYWKLIC